MDVSAITGSCVVMQTAYRVWATGVACSTANFFHVLEYIVSNSLVSNSYFYWTKNAGTESYGVGSGGAVANSLYENNIIQGVVDPLNAAGSCAGCVFAYNFSVNDYDNATDYLFASSPMHASSTDYILEEGNIGAGNYEDMTHGPHFMNTLFRNYWTGYESNNGTMPLYSTIPVAVGAFSRYNNYLGNVLGTAGYHTVYECVPSSASEHYCSTDAGTYPGSVHVWDVGFSNIAQIDYDNTPPTPNDLLTVSSLYRYGNYDVVHGTVQWNAFEVPTADPNFPNPVPGSNAFPSSFYNGVAGAFPSCGSGLAFWKNPTTGTCPPYPSVGPDVTNGDIGICTSGAYKWSRAINSSQCAGGSFTASVSGAYGNSNPAMRCYLNQMAGPPDGTGSMLTFNPAACYAADTGTSPVTATPAFTPVSGAYSSAQTVSISDATAGATIYYTTGNSTPTTSSAVYSTPITVSQTETINAIAAAGGYTPSPVASATYTIDIPALITPTVTVSPASSSITTAQNLQVSVVVSGGGANPAPTGGIVISSGSYSSQAAPLSGGNAGIDIPAGSLALGSDTLTASYTPDANSSARYNSASGTATVTVTSPPTPGFTVSGTAVTVEPGATSGNTSTISVVPSGGFTGSVALAATISAEPSGAAQPPTLSFGSTSPVSITGSTTGTATLTVSTTAPGSTAYLTPNRRFRWSRAAGAAFACLLLFAVPISRRKWQALFGAAVLLAILASGVSGCGVHVNAGSGSSNPGTTPGTYTVTVTATSGSIANTATLSLIVD